MAHNACFLQLFRILTFTFFLTLLLFIPACIYRINIFIKEFVYTTRGRDCKESICSFIFLAQ